MENEILIEQVREKARKWLSEAYSKETRERVNYLLENDEKELIESFYRNLEFGTGGLRGIMGVGTNRMNVYTVAMATQGLCNYVKKQFAGKKDIKAVVGYDSRINSRLYAETTAEVFSANGIKVYLFDELCPTPEVSFAIRHYGCQCGVMLTASHNPKEYNGYKAYWEDGGQIIEPHDENIINEVLKIKSLEEVNFNTGNSKISLIGTETDDVYLDQIKKLSVNPEIIKKYNDLKIVYTPIHGAGYKLVPLALQKFGFTNIYSVREQNVPDGNFPTVKSPNPEEHAALQLAVDKALAIDADLVMATDPDADRVGVAVKNQNGELNLLNGNQVASLLIYYLIKAWAAKGKLVGNEYICKTIVTTDLLNEIADKEGVKHFDVLTGFKYIADIIRKNEGKLNFIGGGEESYGYLAGEFVRDKDAVIACALIAEITAWAKDQNKSLFNILIDIYLEFGLYRESLVSLTKKGKEGVEEIKGMMDKYRMFPPVEINSSKVIRIHDYKTSITYDRITGDEEQINLPDSDVLQFILEDGTKISIRPSGTEPKIKYYFSVREKLEQKQEYEKMCLELDKRILAIQDDLGLR